MIHALLAVALAVAVAEGDAVSSREGAEPDVAVSAELIEPGGTGESAAAVAKGALRPLTGSTSTGSIPPLRPAPPAAPTGGRVVHDPEGLIPRLAERLDRLETFRAAFTQRNQYAVAAFADTFSGELFARMETSCCRRLIRA